MMARAAALGERTYVEGSTWEDGDDRLHTTYFTYRIDAGLVGGAPMTVHFTVDGTRKEAWPFVKDFNAWQNSEGYYYDSVVGDQEGGSFRLSTDPNDFEGSPSYDVIKVIPEYAIVVSQPIPEGAYGGKDWSIGQGGVSAGFHIVGLDQFGDKTIVTFHMEHASIVGNESEDATETWRPMTEEAARKWREGFVPNMKRLVAEARRNA